jgi:hypothetical protein
VRLLAILLAFVMAGASAQDVPQKKKKAAAKKSAAKAHAKPTAEQIRKFNELEKKQK